MYHIDDQDAFSSDEEALEIETNTIESKCYLDDLNLTTYNLGNII